MKYLLKTHNFFKDLSTFKFIIIITFLSVIIFIPLYPISFFLDSLSKTPNAGSNIVYKNFTYKLFIGCFIGPILETLIFQSFIICVLKRIKLNKIIIILISSLFFGLSHTYSITYMFKAFIGGIFLAYSYILYKNKPQSPFWVVTGIHSLRNLIALATMYI